MVLHFLCRLFSNRCEPPRPETPAATGTPDLGQKEATNEARSEEQLRHMEEAKPKEKP
jgi:hypothetical protein